MNAEPSQPASVADVLLHLSRRVRQAESSAELRFIAVNETRALAHYRQAALWLTAGSSLVLSGVVSPEANAPYTQWLQRIFRRLTTSEATTPIAITPDLLEPQDAAEWAEWLPANAVWVPFPRQKDDASGGLMLARDEPWSAPELQALGEWIDIWWHAYTARQLREARKGWRFGANPSTPHTSRDANAAASPASPNRLITVLRGLWRSRWQRFSIIALLCAFIPVRLTVLAPGELVPNNPSAIRAPLDGTIDRFLIEPNQRVKAGEPLFQLDLTSLTTRLAIAKQELATAEAEYRQSAQQAVFDARSKSQLATLQGRISERKTEVSYLEAQLQRAQIVAPRDGVVLVDDPSEWIGKPVATGEKVMTIADEYDVVLEAWLSPGDLIDLPPDTRVTLYLNASPLDPIAAKLLYAAHEAVARPDGQFAYRLRARIEEGQADQRVGLKGTARIAGKRVPLIYWVLRRPLATLRPYLGL